MRVILALCGISGKATNISPERGWGGGGGREVIRAVSPVVLPFRNSVPGEPGTDYPILASVQETSFSCEGLTYGGEYHVVFFSWSS
jgi:hypothetical protein